MLGLSPDLTHLDWFSGLTAGVLRLQGEPHRVRGHQLKAGIRIGEAHGSLLWCLAMMLA
jgi:hypothetical protein